MDITDIEKGDIIQISERKVPLYVDKKISENEFILIGTKNGKYLFTNDKNGSGFKFYRKYNEITDNWKNPLHIDNFNILESNTSREMIYLHQK